MQATLDRVVAANPRGNAQTFWFKPERPMRYTAGQYIEMFLPHPDADNRGVKRWFTLSSSPSEDLISITTKLASDQRSSFKQALVSLEPGQTVKISDAMGDFVLPKDPTIPLLFVAGGIGVTPMRSMIQWLRDSAEQRDVTLLYAVNSLEELAFEDLFMHTPGVILKPIITNPPAEWQGLRGRLTSDMILQHLPTDPRGLIFISGPEPLVETLEKELHQKAIDKHRLVLDFFPNYTPEI